MRVFKKFYACPHCGRAICGEKREYFVCPDCGNALCLKEDVENFTDNYCGNCGCKLDSAKKEASALSQKENQHCLSTSSQKVVKEPHLPQRF